MESPDDKLRDELHIKGAVSGPEGHGGINKETVSHLNTEKGEVEGADGDVSVSPLDIQGRQLHFVFHLLDRLNGVTHSGKAMFMVGTKYKVLVDMRVNIISGKDKSTIILRLDVSALGLVMIGEMFVHGMNGKALYGPRRALFFVLVSTYLWTWLQCCWPEE